MKKSPYECSGQEATLLLYNAWEYPCPMVQANIWSRVFLMEHRLRFVPGLQYEDSEFSPRAIYLARRVIPLHEPFYRYRIRDNSITTTASNKLETFLGHLAIRFKSLFRFHATECALPGFDARISRCLAGNWLRLLRNCWFHPINTAKINEQRRRDTLNVLFADGFDDFKKIAKADTACHRMLAHLVRLWVCPPSVARLVDFFFHYFGFPLAEFRSKALRNSLPSPWVPQKPRQQK